jgi:hypothetical protein
MSRYSLGHGPSGYMIIDNSLSVPGPLIVARVCPEVSSATDAYAECMSHLNRLLSAPAQFEVTQRLMSEEEFRQVQELRAGRKVIQNKLQAVAVDKTLKVSVDSQPMPELGEAAVRGVLNKLMDDLAHNGNAIRKLGVEPAPIDTALAEAVEAQLAVITSAE